MTRREGADAAIRDEIGRSGPIGFDRFMELALYGPGGFFQRDRSPVGRAGDFVTSPHVHPFVFSRCVRAALLDAWAALGEPDPLTLVELGAGDGTLTDALAEAFGELPRPSLSYTAVEIGDGVRGSLAARGLRAVPALADVEPFEGVMLANEVLDNLPFRLARRQGGEICEVRVGVDGDGSLVRVTTPWREPPVAPTDLAWLEEGRDASVPVALMPLLDALAERLRRGYAILIDYGDRGRSDGAHGYADQRPVDDVLGVTPGASDITAGVDVNLVASAARDRGLVVFEPVRQWAALDALGFARWNATMRARQVELERVGRGSEAVRVWASRSRATVLVDPERLGALWWIVLATNGLPEPPWLGDARTDARLGPATD